MKIKTLAPLFLCLSLSFACSSLQKMEPPKRVIDAHTHTAFNNQEVEGSGISYSADGYLKEWNEVKLAATVSMNQEGGAGYFSPPGKTIANCFGVHLPLRADLLEQGLKAKKYACIKIYLGYVHEWANSKAYRPAYHLAEKYGVPVVFHTGDTDSTKAKLKYADPLTVDEVAVDFPKVNFVIAHCGNPWIQSAAEVAYKNPNVYLDGSAFLIGKLSEYSDEDLNKYVVDPIRYVYGYVENPKKLMFGTDWPLVRIKDYLSVFQRAIPKEHWDEVFYQNARRVFHLNALPE